MGFQADTALTGTDRVTYIDIALICVHAHIIRDTHSFVKIDTSLLADIDSDALLGRNIIRDMHVAIATMEGNAATGIQHAVIPDDEVSGRFSLHIDILAGLHRNVAVFRGCLSLDINGSQISSHGDILFRIYCFFASHISDTNDNIAFAHLHRYVFILGFDGTHNKDYAFTQNIGSDVPIFSDHIAFHPDAAISLHDEASLMPCRKRGWAGLTCELFQFLIFRHRTNVDACMRRSRLQRLDDNVMTGFKVASHVIESISDGHAYIISCVHTSAQTIEGTIWSFNHDIMHRIGIA